MSATAASEAGESVELSSSYEESDESGSIYEHRDESSTSSEDSDDSHVSVKSDRSDGSAAFSDDSMAQYFADDFEEIYLAAFERYIDDLDVLRVEDDFDVDLVGFRDAHEWDLEYLDEGILRDFHRQLCERAHEGVPPAWFESSYFPSHQIRPSLYGWIVDYDRCTPEELQRFVRERRLADPYPTGLTMKYFYIRVLEAHDKVTCEFRLLDLPPEVRVMIYEELLTLVPNSEGKKFCRPAILSASRQIYAEANDILYCENTIVAKAQVGQNPEGGWVVSGAVHNQDTKGKFGHSCVSGLLNAMTVFPPFLRRIRRLKIQLTLDAPGLGTTLSALGRGLCFNHFVYGLASFLMQGHNLEHLTLEVQIGDGGEADLYDYSATLFPLRRLRNVRRVTFQGYLPLRLQQKLLKDLNSNEPCFNTLHMWKLLHAKALAQIRLNSATGRGVCSCVCGELRDDIRGLPYALYTAEDGASHSATNSHREENFLARLDSLKKALTESEAKAELEAMLADWNAAHKAIKDHEKLEDDGRLAEAGRLWRGRVAEDDWEDGWESDDVEMLEGLDDNTWSDASSEALGESPEFIAAAETQPLLNSSGTAKALQAVDPTATDEEFIWSEAKPPSKRRSGRE